MSFRRFISIFTGVIAGNLLYEFLIKPHLNFGDKDDK